MNSKASWRQQSLEKLEDHHWGDPEIAPTGLVKRCMQLSKVPLEHFTPADLRLMIGQTFGLPYLIPLAIEALQNDIFTEAGLYEGDLLENVLRIETSFWDDNELFWNQLHELIKDKRDKINELGIATMNFDNCKFRHTNHSA